MFLLSWKMPIFSNIFVDFSINPSSSLKQWKCCANNESIHSSRIHTASLSTVSRSIPCIWGGNEYPLALDGIWYHPLERNGIRDTHSHLSPCTEWLTDTSENITLPQLHLRAVKTQNMRHSLYIYSYLYLFIYFGWHSITSNLNANMFQSISRYSIHDSFLHSIFSVIYCVTNYSRRTL